MPHTAASYHHATSYDRYAMTPHSLDWKNQPVPYKQYPGIESIALPEVTDLYAVSLFEAFQQRREKDAVGTFDLEALSRVLILACGLTAKARQPGGEFYFRSAPSAGALYPNELYLLWPGTGELSAGLYHYGVHNRRLTPLRTGAGTLEAFAVCGGRALPALPVFIVSGIFFRSAWKYRSRAYRYVLMDAGHLLENLRLALSAAGFFPELQLDFDDAKLDDFLGLDRQREAALAWIGVKGAFEGSAASVELGEAGASVEPGQAALPSGAAEASRVAQEEVVYEEILDIHRSGEKLPEPFVAPPDPAAALGLTPEAWQPVAALAVDSEIRKAPIHTYAEAVIRRRSRRNFVPRPMEKASFACLLSLLCQSGAKSEVHSQSAACGCLVGQVEGLEPGFYLLDQANARLARVAKGDYRREMAAICLNQAWLAGAAVHFVVLSPLALVDQTWGARGYRYAMISAGRLGHALYLGSTALGLGCCGIGAFFDGEAGSLLGFNPDSAMLYLLASGVCKD